MGRPLYSRTFRSNPAVREPEPPSCEKWSHLNAFDPDSDEFFDNENTVYEDFIGPVMPLHSEDEDEEEERDMLVVRMGNASPISSESSLSDSESSLAVSTEDPTHPVVDALRDIRQIGQRERESGPIQDPAVRVRLATRAPSRETRWATDSGRPYLRRGVVATAPARTIAYRSQPQREVSIPVPAPSAPIPVPAASRRSAAIDERVFSSPSTPPRQTPMTYSISPPPTSTPRLYSWTRNPSHSTPPSSNGPFTNPHARTSYAHLSPALIRIRDVTV